MVRMRLMILAIVALAAWGIPGAPAHATGYAVTKTADTMDFVCDADCSLREALYAANNAFSPPHIILLPDYGAIYQLTIPGTGEELGLTGDLDIRRGIYLLGEGNPIIQIDGATMNDRVIHVSLAGGERVQIQGVTIRGGVTAGEGAGIYSDGAELVVRETTVSGNSAANAGGGIFVTGISGSLTLMNSTVSGNTAYYGGGIVSQGNFATTTLTNSTINGNSSGYGGGLYNLGDAVLTNTTISSNLALEGGGINNSGGNVTINNNTISANSAQSAGGGITNVGGNVVIQNSIVANSSPGGNCSGDSVLISNGFNLGGDATCGFTAAGDIINTNPMLGPLALNGGFTRTRALLDGSPAADAGGPGCPATDQRWVSRPQGLGCDIGAYEAPDTDTDGVPNPLDSDDDDDTVPDVLDSCPLVAEDIDGYQDEGGCPDADNDGDGICDLGLTAVSCTGSDVGRYLWKNPLSGMVDCRNVAEDYDNFHDTDGCPEPDNDYDTFQDFTDDCPGADSNVGPDGIADTGDEPILYLTPYQAREDFDGVIDWDGCHDSPNDDYDGDGAGDETEVFTMLTDPVNPDTDADTVIDGADNCPNWPNTPQNLPPWTVPANDSDCDGFTVAREQWTGTNPTKHCNVTATANDEAIDFWPSDFNDSRLTSLADVVLMGPVYNQSAGTDPAKRRFDLNASGTVSLADVVLMGPFYNKSCG